MTRCNYYKNLNLQLMHKYFFACINPVQLQYPTECNPKMCNTLFSSILGMFWGQSTIIRHYERHYITKPKCKWIVIPVLGYSIKHHVLIHFGLHYQKGIIHDQKDGMKLQYPSQRYLENAEWLITYILTISRVLHNPTKNLEWNQYPNWGIL